VLPRLELTMVDVEGTSADVAEEHVVIAQHEFAQLETDRENITGPRSPTRRRIACRAAEVAITRADDATVEV